MEKINRKSGFLQLIIILVIGLLILSYFGFDLKSFLDKPIVQDNLKYAWNLVLKGWELIKGPVLKVYNLILNLIPYDGIKEAAPKTY